MITDADRGADLLMPSEAAELLRVNTSTLRRWDDAGKLKAVVTTPGGHRRFRRADVEALIGKGQDT